MKITRRKLLQLIGLAPVAAGVAAASNSAAVRSLNQTAARDLLILDLPKEPAWIMSGYYEAPAMIAITDARPGQHVQVSVGDDVAIIEAGTLIRIGDVLTTAADGRVVRRLRRDSFGRFIGRKPRVV